MPREIDVLVSTGELSGDRIAARVVAELRRARPGLRFFGAGGPALAGQGVELRHRVDDLAVTGLTEALGRGGAAARLVADCVWQVRRRCPQLALLVDYPGVNLRLAGMLRRAGVPVVYCVAPQRWAWLAWRAPAIARKVDRLAVTLPFEERWFAAQGVRATFVGNPVVDVFAPLRDRSEARRRLGLADAPRHGDRPVVGLLPGSRPAEVRRHLPLLREAAQRLRCSGARAALAAIEGSEQGRLCRQLAPELPRGDAATVLGAADVALCASGTATLEAVLADVPVVVFYRTSFLTHLIGQHLLAVSLVALPNLILGERLLPELIQQQVTAETLACEALQLQRPENAARVRDGYRRVRAALGDGGVAARVAALALPLLPSPRRSG